ncbi:MAG: bifunctional diaminohydroxyphosphoribosylaminopyrimidine deaminase/5-amino-6-(5-phosphoribosylamino)uracil reductase RibD [Candidatus Binatus sp.]|uniref:bifunctional diaminohydroxyphosphoribosylaminopyrimidine deaminase/5-amino-6-(5-phosphoribosylamino)uracil reductase RibD n=1 Tax=Candidatus Binatus sp. TaxID=2811406 RepID=UPI0027183A05|nr:bifunctional diaminohydroxyphosphoribosylaminopyrimidine deaminase/5-amino-6-(5-phosphoribosylamino)uracil reductase RibD [Candidatus Binatus sp.]MDO8430945.1 bifunctional diaminohydroxyphosphoribosylaminopyrimidine deaminase/5-amino-6-(5-phosphoribosylamino)uracil reductase RibD [Candidatus Binatus sp.]
MKTRGADETDRRFMREALAQAESMLGMTSPNPTVGCVLVRAGKVVGRGVTSAGGRPHGETNALAQAGSRARGATAYVSLEPCAHHGQTPPCADAIVEAGIARVVIGCGDPDPRVHGRGIAILKRAGIRVTSDVLRDEAARINEGFFARIARGRPLGILKLAMSLDGRIAAEGGDSRWISTEESRAMVHRWRRECDAVMVGAGTVAADDPRLTCRIEGGRDPVRVVVDANLRTPADAKVYRQRSTAPAIIATTQANLAFAKKKYERRGVEAIAIADHGGEIALDRLMQEFGGRGWSRVLIEGGARLAASALRADVVDRVAFFVAPKIMGAGLPAIDGMHLTRIRDAIQLSELSARPVGVDWLFEGKVVPAKRRRK